MPLWIVAGLSMTYKGLRRKIGAEESLTASNRLQRTRRQKDQEPVNFLKKKGEFPQKF